MIDLGVDTDSIDDVSGKITRGVERYLIDGAQFGQNIAMEEVPEDRSQLRMSMAQFVPEVRDGSVVWGTSDAPHALPIEEGTEPFWAPIQPLIEWANRQGEDEGLAYAAQWKIAQEGITPQPYLSPGAEAQADWYARHDIDGYIEDELE